MKEQNFVFVRFRGTKRAATPEMKVAEERNSYFQNGVSEYPIFTSRCQKEVYRARGCATKVFL
jgi:hypothetical protein